MDMASSKSFIKYVLFFPSIDRLGSTAMWTSGDVDCQCKGVSIGISGLVIRHQSLTEALPCPALIPLKGLT